jgi:transcription initiation factor TFIIIB Brf1 subunit/transcription initiation factor TFIIB
MIKIKSKLNKCPFCNSNNIEYSFGGIICKNTGCPSKNITITTSDTTNSQP